jgi:hypothetical protein
MAIARKALQQAARRAQRTPTRRYLRWHQAHGRSACPAAGGFASRVWEAGGDSRVCGGDGAGLWPHGPSPLPAPCGVCAVDAVDPCGPTPCPHRRLGQGANAPSTAPYGHCSMPRASASPRRRAGLAASVPSACQHAAATEARPAWTPIGAHGGGHTRGSRSPGRSAAYAPPDDRGSGADLDAASAAAAETPRPRAATPSRFTPRRFQPWCPPEEMAGTIAWNAF